MCGPPAPPLVRSRTQPGRPHGSPAFRSALTSLLARLTPPFSLALRDSPILWPSSSRMWLMPLTSSPLRGGWVEGDTVGWSVPRRLLQQPRLPPLLLVPVPRPVQGLGPAPAGRHLPLVARHPRPHHLPPVLLGVARPLHLPAQLRQDRCVVVVPGQGGACVPQPLDYLLGQGAHLGSGRHG